MTLCTIQTKAEGLAVQVITWKSCSFCVTCGVWRQNSKDWLLVLHGDSFDTFSGFHFNNKTFSLFTPTLIQFLNRQTRD